MKQEEIQRIGLYRLYWCEGGSSLAAVGMLCDGTRWFAPVNWVDKDTTGIACTDWEKVCRVELIEEPKFN